MPRPLDPVTSTQRTVYGLAFFAGFVALWSIATFGGFVSKTFLANPITMLHEGWLLLTQYGFAYDIGITIWRVVGGFVLAGELGRLEHRCSLLQYQCDSLDHVEHRQPRHTGRRSESDN